MSSCADSCASGSPTKSGPKMLAVSLEASLPRSNSERVLRGIIDVDPVDSFRSKMGVVLKRILEEGLCGLHGGGINEFHEKSDSKARILYDFFITF